jgi:septal ring factor EnvC (AmiA/AmiB activator)
VAAELTGLSKNAIRARIRRHAIDSDLRNGRHRIPLAELRRQGLLVERDHYASLRTRLERLEAELRKAAEDRQAIERKLRESQATIRMLWSKARQRDVQLAHLGGRRVRRGIRFPRLGKRSA